MPPKVAVGASLTYTRGFEVEILRDVENVVYPQVWMDAGCEPPVEVRV